MIFKETFFQETDFQNSSIGKVPNAWQLAKLDTVLSLEYGKGLPEKERMAGGYPVIGSNGIVGYHIEALVNGPGIVIGRKGTIGAITWVNSDFWPIDTAYYVKLKREDVSLKWLQRELSYLNLSKLSLADVVPGLKRDLVYSHYIPIPPLIEQNAIVGVLDVVDSAIELADRIIAKTERLKKGLMQELLTKGIGHIEYKETPIGKIPKDWEIVELRDLILDIKNGFASGKRDENGIAQIRMNNLTTDGRLVLESYLKVPCPEKIDTWLLKPNDFLVNNTNSIDLVGKSAIFKGTTFPCTYSNHFTRIRFKENVILPELVLYHFIMQWERGYFKSVAIRHVSQAAVHTEYLLRLRIPLPSINEQQRIIEILSTTNHKLELERNERGRLESIKHGLMDLLLTGKVRIKVA